MNPDLLFLLIVAPIVGAMIYVARRLRRRRPFGKTKPPIRLSRKQFIHRR